MNYKDYLTEDFLADKKFIKWINNPTDNTNNYWAEVILNNPEKKEEIEKAIKLAKLIHFRKLSTSEHQKDNIFEKTISHNYSTRSKHHEKSIKTISGIKIAQIVAISLVVISIGVLLAFQSSGWIDITSTSTPEEVKVITKKNPAGRKSRFYLPDGSYVTLNAESKLYYYTNFKANRELWLSGEASFEVKEGSENDFLVHTNNLFIRVKGTTFNVCAFTNDLHESISLLSGKVFVSCDNEYIKESYELIPGEKLSVNLESNKLFVTDLIMDDVIWSSGILVFRNDDIDSFTKKIQRWYGVKVEVSGTPKVKININGKFDNESLKNVLESLKFSTDISYQLNDNKVLIDF